MSVCAFNVFILHLVFEIHAYNLLLPIMTVAPRNPCSLLTGGNKIVLKKGHRGKWPIMVNHNWTWHSILYMPMPSNIRLSVVMKKCVCKNMSRNSLFGHLSLLSEFFCVHYVQTAQFPRNSVSLNLVLIHVRTYRFSTSNVHVAKYGSPVGLWHLFLYPNALMLLINRNRLQYVTQSNLILDLLLVEFSDSVWSWQVDFPFPADLMDNKDWKIAVYSLYISKLSY